MLKYIVKRLILGIFTLLVIMFASYGMLRLAPGDPADSNFFSGSDAGISSAEKNENRMNESMRSKLMLDKPIFAGFAHWLKNLVCHGDLGESVTVQPGKPVIKIIAERMPVTIKLNLLAMTAAYILAIAIGVYSARYSDTFFDRFTTMLLFILYSLPVMWVAVILKNNLCEGSDLEIFPLNGTYDPEAAVGTFEAITMELYHYTLPAICLAYGSMTVLARYTRSNMLDVLSSDFIRTAHAKGVSGQNVLWKHAFGNTLITLITLFSGLLPSLIGGSIIIEHIFNIPGMGELSFKALSNRDYPLQMALFIISGALTLLGILIADILYTIADPRVKLD